MERDVSKTQRTGPVEVSMGFLSLSLLKGNVCSCAVALCIPLSLCRPPPTPTPHAPPPPPVFVTDQPFISSLSCDRWLLSLPSCCRVAWRLLLLSRHSRYKDKKKKKEKKRLDALICPGVLLRCCGSGRHTRGHRPFTLWSHVFAFPSRALPTALRRTRACISGNRSIARFHRSPEKPPWTTLKTILYWQTQGSGCEKCTYNINNHKRLHTDRNTHNCCSWKYFQTMIPHEITVLSALLDTLNY